jgi:hypothetical protein
MVWKIVGRLRAAHAVLNAVSVSLVGIVVAALVVASLLAAFKVIPWPQIALFFGGQAVPQAGMWLQLGLTGLMLLLLFYLPANLRISRLERSHCMTLRAPMPMPMPLTARACLACRPSLRV